MIPSSLRLLALPVSIGASLLVAAQPAWSLLQIAGLILLGGSVALWLGKAGAFFLVTGILALLGSEPGGESVLARIFLPLYVVFACGAVLATAVLRWPALGRQIETGPMGPGSP